MFLEIITHLVGSEAVESLGKLAPYSRFLVWKMRRRKHRMRISFAALLCVHKDNQYVLVRSLHRPEGFGPIGGVFKFSKHDDVLIQNFEFEPQFYGDSRPDLIDDLRGFVPAKRLFNVVKWFEKGQGRESASECLSRELKEEFEEISCPTNPDALVSADLSKIRSVYEGPEPVANQGYWQFRIVEVYRLKNGQKHESLLKQLRSTAKDSPHVAFASAEEINSGRLKSGLGIIGRQAEYLLRAKSHRAEAPPIVALGA
jgi:hypothetical protein